MKNWQWAAVSTCDNFSSLPFKLSQLSQLVKLTVGISGSSIRLSLANRYGDNNLVFDQVLVADNPQMTNGQVVTTARHSTIVVPAGQVLVTDSIAYSATAGQPIYVQMVARRAQTYADFANTYDPRMVNGTYGRTAQLLPLLPTGYAARKGWFCLEGVQVFSNDLPLKVKLTGDSLAEMGMVATNLVSQLHKRSGRPVVLINTAVSGSRLLNDAPLDEPLFATFGQSLLHRLAKPRWMADVTVALTGSNDLVLPFWSHDAYLPTSQQLVNGVDNLSRLVAQQGSRLVMTTIPPFDLHLPASQAAVSRHLDEVRFHINQQLVKRPFVVNVEPLVGANGRLRPSADFGDQLHYSPAGAILVASALFDWIDDKMTISNNG
ncbi:MAG: hypothetical protein LKJ72_03600 [[Lactobacillus] timonensis]|uniref:hypothetical protein n=1 Tax=[Lactobacillus] timonensis TaxID=1970790 RepID=UPI0023520C22|nr:hypothetical protein [[Lactobacillus] timonensis]MCI1926054.1 hypothetical protein [[Lactobacillus] timonensis]MCI1957446.1 hypothetical protein [[Lactobacillus] timonensis]MCI1970404.1 hypothetical protein [[Lactobacillus] timonensis]MCI2006640.1 hypothetical protein [[Lactobacillus] timonensis]